MSLRKYFKPASALPTLKESGLSMHATTEANKAVERALQRETEAESTSRKKEVYVNVYPQRASSNREVCC